MKRQWKLEQEKTSRDHYVVCALSHDDSVDKKGATQSGFLMIALGISSLQEVDNSTRALPSCVFGLSSLAFPEGIMLWTGPLFPLNDRNTIGKLTLCGWVGARQESQLFLRFTLSTFDTALIQLEQLSNLRTLACKQFYPNFVLISLLIGSCSNSLTSFDLYIDFGCRCAFHLPWLNDPTELMVTVGRNCYPLTFSAHPYLEDLTIRAEIYLHPRPPD